jgi:hypothetical protein
MTADVAAAVETESSPPVLAVLPKPFDIMKLISSVRESLAAV